VTVEGLAPTGGGPHPPQEAFAATHSLQCGFCASGFLITMLAFLAETPEPDEPAVREALSAHPWFCVGYRHIVDGVLLAGRRMAGTR
jgi:carbon-monoxide dehydrogenase small subunit